MMSVAMMDDRERLVLLYTSIPETSEQSIRRDMLIKDLEIKLGIRQQDNEALAVNGDLDDLDVEGISAKRR